MTAQAPPGQPPVVLVTGATGFAGRCIVPALQAAGFAVRGHFVRKPGADPRVEWRRADFLHTLDMAPLVEGCAAVVHLAAALNKPEEMDRLNVEATAALAKVAAAAGVRYFAHASSIVVYGSPRTREVTEENPLLDPTKPLGAQYRAEPYMLQYARTKALGELVLRDLALPMQVDILRPVVVADSDRLLEIGDWSLARKMVTLYRRTQYMAEEDAAAGVVHLLERGLGAPQHGCEAYNLAYETSATFREVCAYVFARTGDRRFAPKPELPVLPDIAKDMLRHHTLELRYPLGMMSVSAAKLHATGYRPKLGLERALDLAVSHAAQAQAA